MRRAIFAWDSALSLGVPACSPYFKESSRNKLAHGTLKKPSTAAWGGSSQEM